MRWQRVDIPGTDTCALRPLAGGWRLEGIAQFASGTQAARLGYAVDADSSWCTRRGIVRGVAAGRLIQLDVERFTTGDWRINGDLMPGLAGLVDLDLGFTPATNLFPLRRLALAIGDAAGAAAVWLDDAAWTFRRLSQRYERRDADHYRYQSPETGYEGLLTVTAEGFVAEYPGLWRAAAADSRPFTRTRDLQA